MDNNYKDKNDNPYAGTKFTMLEKAYEWDMEKERRKHLPKEVSLISVIITFVITFAVIGGSIYFDFLPLLVFAIPLSVGSILKLIFYIRNKKREEKEYKEMMDRALNTNHNLDSYED